MKANRIRQSLSGILATFLVVGIVQAEQKTDEVLIQIEIMPSYSVKITSPPPHYEFTCPVNYVDTSQKITFQVNAGAEALVTVGAVADWDGWVPFVSQGGLGLTFESADYPEIHEYADGGIAFPKPFPATQGGSTILMDITPQQAPITDNSLYTVRLDASLFCKKIKDPIGSFDIIFDVLITGQ